MFSGGGGVGVGEGDWRVVREWRVGWESREWGGRVESGRGWRWERGVENGEWERESRERTERGTLSSR
jgi:hypothetical protein